MNDYQALKNWIEQNTLVLKDRSVEDIGDMAIACGFNRTTVSQWQTSVRFKEAI